MNICGRCGEEVYFAERKLAIGKVWHSFCFSCRKCGKLLDSCSVCPYNSELYCPACFRGVSSTPNLPSCFRSKPSYCNPCIPFKPRQYYGRVNTSPPCEDICCRKRIFTEENHRRKNCAYCNQCYCECCSRGCNLGLQQDEDSEIEAEGGTCFTCNQVEVPVLQERCCSRIKGGCDCSIGRPEPVLPYFPRLYCSRQPATRRKPQKAETHSKSFRNYHCCVCEGCTYRY